MKNSLLKKVLCVFLCVLIAAAFFGCGTKENKQVNLRDKLASLAVTDEAIGVKEKYTSFEEIEGGGIDADLIGTWVTANAATSYTFTEDGVQKVKAEQYGEVELKYTCVTLDGYKVLCSETTMTSIDEEENQEVSTVISYTAYNVDNDALYMVEVEDTTSDMFTSAYSSLITAYKADESGSAASSIAKNAIDIASYDGTWTTDKGEFTIADGTLTLGDDVFDLSMDDKDQLVVGKDGTATAYAIGIAASRQYDSDDRSNLTEGYSISLTYTGADENDKPNLLSVLDDWKTEFQYDIWYYNGSFALAQ